MKQEPVVPETKKKRSGWSRFLTFLIMGGWILIMLLVVGVIMAVSSIKGC